MSYNRDSLLEARHRPKADFIMPPDNSASGVRKEDILTKKGIKNQGLENDTEGFWNIVGENVSSASKGLAGSIAQTFGNSSFAATMEAENQMNLDYDAKTIKEDGFMSWLGQSTGQAIPSVTGAIGAGVVSGGIGLPAAVGSGAFSFISMQGSNYREMRKWKPDASIAETWTASSMLSLVQAAVEQVGGLESLGAKKILAGRTVKELADEMMETATRNNAMSFMQKALTTSKNRAVSVAKGAISEFGEESIQGAMQLIAGEQWGDQKYTSEEIMNALVYDPARALPTGGLMGGVFHSANNDGKAATSLAKPDDNARTAIFSQDSQDGPVLDVNAMEADDQAFTALETELKSQYGRSAKSAVDVIRSIAYTLSFVSQTKHGESKLPADFIKDLKIAFVDQHVSPEQMADIESIRSDTSISAQERGENILDYIAQNMGDESELYKSIKGVGQIVEASSIASSSADIISTLERHAPQLSPEKHSEWKASVTENITRMQRIGESNPLIPSRSKPEPMTYNEVGENLSRSDIARIFIEEPIIKLGDAEYVVKADDRGISFVEATENTAQFNDIVSEFIGVISNERSNMKVTGGEQMLANEKAMHGMLEQKIFIGNILDAYDNRQDSKSFEEFKMKMDAKEKALADEASIKNVQTEALKQGELEEGTELTREVPSDLAEVAASGIPSQEQVDRVKSINKDVTAKTDSLVESFKNLKEQLSKQEEIINKAEGEEIDTDAMPQEVIDLAREFNEKVQPLVDELSIARENKDMAKSIELLSKIRKARESIGMDKFGEIVFDEGDIQFDDRPISQLTEAEIMAEAEKAGVIFQSWMEPVHWPEFKDPQNLGNFTVMSKYSFKQALDTHRAKDWSNMHDIIKKRTESAAGLFEDNQKTINGLYIPTERTAIFFKNAGVNTVIHEFVHHARSILPIDMQSALLETFNQQTGNNSIGWGVDADEWFVNSMMKWIVNKEQPFTAHEKDKAGAFLMARRIVMNAYKDFDLSEDTAKALDEIFGEIPDQAAVFGAKQAMDSMISLDPPTASQVSELFAGKDGSRFSSKEDDLTPPSGTDYANTARFDASSVDPESNASFSTDERNQVRKKIYAISGGRDQALSVAKSVFGDDVSGLGSLTDDELLTVMHIAEMSTITNDSQVAAKAESDGETLFNHAKETYTEAASERVRSDDSRAVKFFTRIKNKIHDAGITGLYTVASEMSMMKILDDMSDSGVWHNIISKPLKAARDLRSALTDQNIKFFSSVIRERGLNMRKIQRQKVDLGGHEYTKGEVAFMAVVNRMRPQDKESFVGSNFSDNRDQGFKLIQMADNMAKSDPQLTGFIDSIQDAFKHVYNDLKDVYKEVTGNEMGKIEWYMPFIRNNDWDDLDVVMSQLNSINARGDEYYKSSTKHMKERTGGAGARIDMADPFGQCIRYINQASTYTAMAKTVKQVSATLRSDGAKAALKWKYGEGSGRRTNWNFVHNILTDLVLGELYHDARIKPMSEAEVVFRNMRTGFSLFALAGNVGTMFKQILSLPIGVARSGMPIQTTARATAEIVKLGSAVFSNSLQNIGIALSGRSSNGYKHVLAGTRVYDLWSNYSPTLLNRHGNPETGEAQSYNFKGLMGIEFAGMPLGEALMAGISTVDALTVGTLWTSTYDSWLKYNKSKSGGNMLEADAMADAAAKADAMIRDTQPPSLPQDRSLLQRGNEFTRSFFMFTGATMRNYEVFMTDIVGRSHKALSGLKSKGVTSLSDVLFKGNDLQSGLVVQLGVGFILPAVIAGMISRRRKPTEEELMYDIMAYPFTALPFMRGILGCVAGVDEDVDQASTYAERSIIEITTGIKAACKAYHGKEWEGRDIQEAIDGLAIMMSFPKVFARTGAAAIIQASGKGSMLEELKAQYIDPYGESDSLKK